MLPPFDRVVPALAPFLLLGLALACAQEPLPSPKGEFPGGGGAAEPPVTADALVGAWQLTLAPANRQPDPLLVVAPNGAFTYSFTQVVPGKLEARWGAYRLTSQDGKPEEGTYAILYPDQMWFTSPLGTAEWRRRSRTDAPDAAVDPSLAGAWQRRAAQGGVSSEYTWEVKPSGECTMTTVGEEKGTWRISRGRCTMTYTGSSFSWQCRLTNGRQTLVLTDAKGRELSFRRQVGATRPK